MSTTPRTQALWMKHHAFSTEEEATEALCDFRDHGNALETELAAAKAECERLKFSTEGHLLKTIQQQAELARLRAEVSEARRAWLGDDYGHLPLIEALEKFRSDSDAESDRADVLYQRSCEVEHKLRAEVERLKALGSWAHTCIHHTDAERQSSVACPVCATAKLPWLHGATENSLTQVVDGTIDGGCIDDRYTIIRVPVSPFGYRVGQPVKVILPKVLVN